MGQFSHIFDDFDEVSPFKLLFLTLFDDSMEFLEDSTNCLQPVRSLIKTTYCFIVAVF
jgi:hypothetical protein